MKIFKIIYKFFGWVKPKPNPPMFYFGRRGSLIFNREYLHQTEGYKRQVEAARQLAEILEKNKRNK